MSQGNVQYLVFPTTEDVWQFMAGEWTAVTRQCAERKGYCAVALSGGKTPVGFYQRLSLMRELKWNKTHIFFADERLVPSDSPESNFGMVQRTLLSNVPIPPENVHPVPTQESTASASAEKYELELKTFFGLFGEGKPAFDLILLGVGEDGHTASLFPGTAVLNEREHWAVPVILGAVLHDRVTLSLPMINRAENIFFLVSGRRKKAVLRKLREGHDKTLPASMVRSEKGKVVFLIDRDAAG